MPAIYVPSVLPPLRRWREAGQRTALVTMIGTDGSSPRPLGSQMAITESGEAVGNITGGCAEAAIIAEAQNCMARNANRSVRYGAGSPYIDIRLPCGSGIDVYFDVNFEDAVLTQLLHAHASRLPAALTIDPVRHAVVAVVGEAEAGISATPDTFTRAYLPTPRLVVVGKGPTVPILARLATAADFGVIALSSEHETLEVTAAHALRAEYLATPASYAFNDYDPWTAFVSLFHEHEWEPTILAQVLSSNCFYIGALGSKRTHEVRIANLRALGVADDLIARIRAPVGLKLGGKNPPEIALAILAEIVQVQCAQTRT